MAMAMVALRRLCLLACVVTGMAAWQESPALQKLFAGNPKHGGALSAPLLDHDDGRLIACSGKNLIAFEGNGSMAWVVPLWHTCNGTIAPVTEQGKVYLVAEDRVIKVTPQKVHTSELASEVFFVYNATPGRSEEITGLAVSGAYSSIFVTVRNLGLFVLSLSTGSLQWSLGPVLDRYGYRLGCTRNISGCYFDSAPVVDHCEGVVYVWDTERQLYSLYIHSRQFRWITDLSLFGKAMTVAPGNSGRLYVVFPESSIVVGLNVSTGNISWQRRVGPLSSEKCLPIVDSNGWMSVGSRDGTLYSISPDGDISQFLKRKAPESVILSSPILDCSGFSMYVSQTITEESSTTIGNYTYVSATKSSSILFTLLAPATGTIYWTGKYPGELSNLLPSSDLKDFTVDETTLLTALSAARIGNTVQCYTRRQKNSWTCGQVKAMFTPNDPGDQDHFLLYFFFQLLVIVMEAVSIWSCCIFWRKKKLQRNGLPKFLERRRSLHNKRKVLGRKISELEQKVDEDAISSEALEHLGEMVKAKKGVERKLYTSYSLGRDTLGFKQGSSILPLYQGKYKSHSFRSSQRESITVFSTFSDTSTSDSGTSSYSDDSEFCSATSSVDMELDVKSGSEEEAGPSNTAIDVEGVQEECLSGIGSPSRMYTNALFVNEKITESNKNVLSNREEVMETMQDRSLMKKSISLKRRRTLSSAY
ncbi:hypothetical protein ACP4OV_027361 [Aristida adscensionis]